MPKPFDTDQVYVVVHTKPNKVWVFCNGEAHKARWVGDKLKDITGNFWILNAALLAWGRTDDLQKPSPNGGEEFVLTYGELVLRSDGWGAWSSEEVTV